MRVLKRVGWLALTLLAPCVFVALQLVAAVAFSVEAAVAASGDAAAAEELYMGSLSSVLLMAQVMTLAVAYPWWRCLKRRRRVAHNAADASGRQLTVAGSSAVAAVSGAPGQIGQAGGAVLGDTACEQCVAGEVEVLSYDSAEGPGDRGSTVVGQEADRVEKSICAAPGGQAVQQPASALNEAAPSAASARLPQTCPSHEAAQRDPDPLPALTPVPAPEQGMALRSMAASAAAAYVLPDEFSPRPVSPRNKAGLVMLGLGVQLTVSVALSVAFALLPQLEQEYTEVMNSGDLGAVALLPILATALGAPVVEEALCRGVTFACARRALPRVWMANVLQALLFAVPHLDPRGESFNRFKSIYQGFSAAFTVFMVVMAWITPLSALGVLPTAGGSFVNVIVFGFLGLLFVGLGIVMPRIEPNYTFGVRLPWTLADPENWRRTHRFAGPVFVVMGVVTVASALLASMAPELTLVVLLVALLGGVALVALYSFLLWKGVVR